MRGGNFVTWILISFCKSFVIGYHHDVYPNSKTFKRNWLVKKAIRLHRINRVSHYEHISEFAESWLWQFTIVWSLFYWSGDDKVIGRQCRRGTLCRRQQCHGLHAFATTDNTFGSPRYDTGWGSSFVTFDTNSSLFKLIIPCWRTRCVVDEWSLHIIYVFVSEHLVHQHQLPRLTPRCSRRHYYPSAGISPLQVTRIINAQNSWVE